MGVCVCVQNDPLTLLKCLTIACEMLRGQNTKGLSPSLQTLLETLVSGCRLQHNGSLISIRPMLLPYGPSMIAAINEYVTYCKKILAAINEHVIVKKNLAAINEHVIVKKI